MSNKKQQPAPKSKSVPLSEIMAQYPEKFIQTSYAMILDDRISCRQMVLHGILARQQAISKNGWASPSISDLAGIFKVDDRTIMRDLENLERAGYIISSKRNGAKSRYQTIDQAAGDEIATDEKIETSDMGVTGDMGVTSDIGVTQPVTWVSPVDPQTSDMGVTAQGESIKKERREGTPSPKKDESKAEKTQPRKRQVEINLDRFKPQPYGTDGTVLLTPLEYDELVEMINTDFPGQGKVLVDRYIEDLADYMASEGKSYKNHKATIRKWYRKAKGEGKVPVIRAEVQNQPAELSPIAKALIERSKNANEEGARIDET